MAELRDRLPSLLDILQDIRIDEPANQQIGVDKRSQLDGRPRPVVAIVRQDHDLTLGRLFDHLPRDQFQFQGKTEGGPGKNPPGAVHHHGLRNRPQLRQVGQYLIEHVRISHQVRCFPVQIIRYGKRIGANTLTMFLKVRVGNGIRRLNRRFDAFAEPSLDADIEKKGRKHRHEDCRCHRHQAEHHDDTDMKAGSRQSAPALPPNLYQLRSDKGAQKDQNHQVQNQQIQDTVGIGPVLRDPCPGHDGRNTGEHGHHGQGEGQFPIEVNSPCPSPQTHRKPPHWRHPGGDGHFPPPLITGMFSSRIFFRSVLRLTPRISAALI